MIYIRLTTGVDISGFNSRSLFDDYIGYKIVFISKEADFITKKLFQLFQNSGIDDSDVED